jgi:hypothetical protein
MGHQKNREQLGTRPPGPALSYNRDHAFSVHADARGDERMSLRLRHHPDLVAFRAIRKIRWMASNPIKTIGSHQDRKGHILVMLHQN